MPVPLILGAPPPTSPSLRPDAEISGIQLCRLHRRGCSNKCKCKTSFWRCVHIYTDLMVRCQIHSFPWILPHRVLYMSCMHPYFNVTQDDLGEVFVGATVWAHSSHQGWRPHDLLLESLINYKLNASNNEYLFIANFSEWDCLVLCSLPIRRTTLTDIPFPDIKLYVSPPSLLIDRDTWKYADWKSVK